MLFRLSNRKMVKNLKKFFRPLFTRLTARLKTTLPPKEQLPGSPPHIVIVISSLQIEQLSIEHLTLTLEQIAIDELSGNLVIGLAGGEFIRQLENKSGTIKKHSPYDNNKSKPS